MSDPAAERRAAAKLLWCTSDLSAEDIAIQTGTSATSIRRWRKQEGWGARPRQSASFRPDLRRAALPDSDAPPPGSPRSNDEIQGNLVARLYRLLNHNIEVLESQMSDDTSSGDSAPERNLRTISNMVRSAEKLKELDTEQSKRLNAPPGGRFLVTPEEEERIRRKVVEHVQRLRERKLREQGDPPA